MDYELLNALIDANIYENTEQEITGTKLNAVLKNIASLLKEGYLFGGMVSPTDTYHTGDARMVFVAAESGRYPDFGNFTVHDGEVCLFMWDTQWTKKIIAYNNPDQVYGVRHYYGNASPDLTRIGAASLHQDLPVQSLMRRCVVNDSGVVMYYLGENDSTRKEDGTAANLSGADGQVMVEVPEHYRKTSLNAAQGYMDTEISLYPFDGAVRVPRYLVSAYEAALDRENNLLSSVVNNTTRFRGGDNTADWDGTYRSLLGLPATKIPLGVLRTYAHNRGAKWGCYDWNMHIDIFWLFAIEYATLNSQKDYNPNLDAAGMHQGGLGRGVSNFANWQTYNGLSPFIPCGLTNSLGNKTGVVTFTLTPEQAEAYGSEHSESVSSYRGIENPFGHVWKAIDGFLVLVAEDGVEGYISRDRSRYADTTNDSYINVGLCSSASGFIKAILASDANLSQEVRKFGDLVVIDNNGSASTYFCDNYYASSSVVGAKYATQIGGDGHYGYSDGLACLRANLATSSSASSIGTRLTFTD